MSDLCPRCGSGGFGCYECTPMTDTTHEAPEKIWACPEDDSWESGAWDRGSDGQGAEQKYVRDDLVQAAVAAALREADKAIQSVANNCTTEDGHVAIIAAVEKVRSLISEDAQAALDRVVAAERDRCAKVAEGETAGPYFRLPAFHGADGCASDESDLAQAARAIAAAIRKGGE